MKRALVIIESEEGHQRFVLGPKHMGRKEARNMVDVAIQTIRANDLTVEPFHELMAALEPQGFVFPHTISTNEKW